MNNSIFSLPPPPGGRELDWKFIPYYHALIVLVIGTPVLGGPHSPVISLAYRRHSCCPGDSKGFRNRVQRPNVYFYYITEWKNCPVILRARVCLGRAPGNAQGGLWTFRRFEHYSLQPTNLNSQTYLYFLCDTILCFCEGEFPTLFLLSENWELCQSRIKMSSVPLQSKPPQRLQDHRQRQD